jgi:hypothetical protein
LCVDAVEHRESVARAIGKLPKDVTENDAKALLDHRRREVLQGRFVPLKDAKRPFCELWAAYWDDVKIRGRKGPAKGHGTLILERWGNVVRANMTTAGIRRWLLDLQARGYTKGTCATDLAYLPTRSAWRTPSSS